MKLETAPLAEDLKLLSNVRVLTSIDVTMMTAFTPPETHLAERQDLLALVHLQLRQLVLQAPRFRGSPAAALLCGPPSTRLRGERRLKVRYLLLG